MKNKGYRLFKVGLKRRKKEVRRMRLMMCLAVFFLAFPFLFQDNMNGYQMDVNYRTFGHWLACSESKTLASNPSLQESGTIQRGSAVYCLWPSEYTRLDGYARDMEAWQMQDMENGEPPECINTTRAAPSRQPLSFIGTITPETAERQRIELIEGRLPENDGEIAMELPLLDALGQGRELGSEISFYISSFDDQNMFAKIYSDFLAELRDEPMEETDVHYDYDLDKIPGRNELHLVKYKLVGTVQRYSSCWDSEMQFEYAEFPGAFLSQSEYDRTEMSKRVYHFYDLRPECEGSEVWNNALEVMKNITNSDAYQKLSIGLNRYAFENPLWGNAMMYRSITILLIVISICIIAYLMANYLGKRRQFFMRMREIGATTADVWKMAVYECVGSVLPPAALTLALAYLLSIIIVFIAANSLNISFFYVFSFKTLLIILAVVALTLAASMLVALLIFSGRSLVEKKSTLSKSALKRVKKRAERRQKYLHSTKAEAHPAERTAAPESQKPGNCYLGLFETLKRGRIASRLKSRLLVLISVSVCAIVIFCLGKTCQPTKDYLEIAGNYSDFYAERIAQIRDVDTRVPVEEFNEHGPHYYIRAEWSRDGLTSSCIIPSSVVNSIDMLSGVNSVQWYSNDFTHRISFEGKDEDPYFQTYLNTFLENNQPYRLSHNLDLSYSFAHSFITAMERDFYGIYCEKDAEEFWHRYESYLDPKVADFDAFLRGEQVIAVVDTEMIRAKQWRPYIEDYDRVNDGKDLKMPEGGPAGAGSDSWYGYPASFSPGDTLNVLCRNDETVPVTIAAVVPLAESGLGYDDERFLTLFGADNFMRRIRSADEPEQFGSTTGVYNSFEADLDVFSANEAVVKTLVNICASNGITFDNVVERKAERRLEMVRAAVTYGIFGLMLTVLFFFVSSCVAKDEELGLAEKYRILSRFGMTSGQMKAEKRRDALHRCLPLLLAFPMQIIIQFISNFNEHVEQIRSWATQYANTPHPALDPLQGVTPLAYTLKLLWSGANTTLALIVIAVFVLFVWLINSRMDKEWEKTL